MLPMVWQGQDHCVNSSTKAKNSGPSLGSLYICWLYYIILYYQMLSAGGGLESEIIINSDELRESNLVYMQ